MRTKSVWLIGSAVLAVLVFQARFESSKAETQTSAALTGQVTSSEEGPMEGVLVNAKKTGSNVTVTVVTDERGRYSFPSGKLEAGHYSLGVRAVGFDLDGAGAAEIAPQKTATVDLKLRKAKDPTTQLTNAEWLMSIPGTDQQKGAMSNCTGCHTLQRVVKSAHDTDEFAQVLARMSDYAPGASPLRPQKRVAIRAGDVNPARFQRQATFLSTINLSTTSKFEYPFKTLPRPKGRATRVVITEYDLPRRVSQPHDVVLDPDGNAWYSDFGSLFVGKLDPKTGKVTEYPLPELKPGFPHGELDLEIDKQGNVWAGMMLQGAIAKFDRKTEKFQIFSLPKEINSNIAQQAMVDPSGIGVDGKMWLNNVGLRGVHRLDVASGTFETFEPYKDLPGAGVPVEVEGSTAGMEGGGGHSVYGIAADSHNNLFFMDFSNTNIGKIDAKTGKVKLYPTPTPDSHPRRGHMDSQDRLWFAEFNTNRIAMFDTKTERFQEWRAPTPWFAPYDMIADRNGELWTGGMLSDRILRMDPKTGQSVEYLLPRNTNVRRVYVDNSTTPVTFWVGSNHGASIVKLEPLD